MALPLACPAPAAAAASASSALVTPQTLTTGCPGSTGSGGSAESLAAAAARHRPRPGREATAALEGAAPRCSAEFCFDEQAPKGRRGSMEVGRVVIAVQRV